LSHHQSSFPALSWAVATHEGLRRQGNEDSFGTRPELGLFVVADGMGGHVAGEVASRVAVESVERFVAETQGLERDGTWPYNFDPALSLAGNRLRSAIRVANRGIAETMATSSELQGMATTLSAVLLARDRAIVAHVGDSRVYLLRDGALQRLTDDHSWVEEQVRAGTLSATAARHHPWRNVVTRALSGGEDPEVDLREVELRTGDRLLLCSDGLYGVVTDERIGAVLGLDRDLQTICDELVEAANRGGGPDNITAVLVQIDAG
jgi:protein phosphatase